MEKKIALSIAIFLTIFLGSVSTTRSQTCPVSEYGDVYCVDYEGEKTDNSNCIRHEDQIGEKPQPHVVTCQKRCTTKQDDGNFRGIDANGENYCNGPDC